MNLILYQAVYRAIWNKLSPDLKSVDSAFSFKERLTKILLNDYN